MADNSEVIAERVANLTKTFDAHIVDCTLQHKSLKDDIGEIHRRVDKILEAVQGQVVIDQKVNTLASHVQNIESTIKDYATTKQHADSAKSTLDWIGRAVLGAVITAVLGMVIVGKIS
jgi:uncharacterized protein YpuA (DUF1002 family)